MMKHADALRQLFPSLFIGGDFAAEINIEGAHLDRAFAESNLLIKEVFPDTCEATLPDWERVYGLVAGEMPIQERRNRVVAKVRDRGGLTIQYFVGLAAALGFTVSVTEGDAGHPFRAGLSAAGDAIYDIEQQWIWTVTVYGSPGPEEALEDLISDLAPAWTQVIFTYVP